MSEKPRRVKEERANKEIQKAIAEAESEERRHETALERARAEIGDEARAEAARLQGLIAEANARKERAVSHAQLTKSGYVYVISNIGSFGEDVFKIGMTRRLEPLDRVRELSGASVPFPFDVHGMVFSEDAPALEARLHRSLEHRRVNLANSRKEFFEAAVEEVQQAVAELGATVELTRLAEARQYRETLAMRKQSQDCLGGEPVVEHGRFPASLDGYSHAS